jgi:hypothetical protein
MAMRIKGKGKTLRERHLVNLKTALGGARSVVPRWSGCSDKALHS